MAVFNIEISTATPTNMNFTYITNTNINISLPWNLNITKLRDLIWCDSETWIWWYINSVGNECIISISKDYNGNFNSKITTTGVVTLNNTSHNDIIYNQKLDYFVKIYVVDTPSYTIKLATCWNISNSNVWYG